MDSDKKTIEQWRDEKKTEGWIFAAAKAGERWPAGKEISEDDYDDAIKRTGEIQIGYGLKDKT